MLPARQSRLSPCRRLLPPPPPHTPPRPEPILVELFPLLRAKRLVGSQGNDGVGHRRPAVAARRQILAIPSHAFVAHPNAIGQVFHFLLVAATVNRRSAWAPRARLCRCRCGTGAPTIQRRLAARLRHRHL